MVGKKEFRYPVIDMRRTGAMIRYICELKKIKVKDIQSCIHISSNQAVYDWFNGKTMPSLNNFYAFSRLVDLSLDDIIVEKADVEQQRRFDEHADEIARQREHLDKTIRRLIAYEEGSII